MSPHFYRFRSARALLEEHQELERQEIYFSPPDQLNDALEGFSNVVWRGDRILWRNLLRHYLLTLLQITHYVAIGGSPFDSSVLDNLAKRVETDLPETPIRSIYREVAADFLSTPLSKAWIEGLSTRDAILSKEEMVGYLRAIHMLAISCVIAGFERHELRGTIKPATRQQMLESTQHLKALFDVHDRAGDGREAFLVAADLLQRELVLLMDISDEQLATNRNWQFIYRDFPGAYLHAIKHLMFPSWYAACFVRQPTHSAMWGVYADGHRGVCLEFRAQSVSDQKAALVLNGQIGWSGSREGKKPLIDDMMLPFEPVQYASSYPETDFFRNLGGLSRYKLNEFWFCDDQRCVSERVKDILAEDEGWRRSYWDRHAQTMTTKLPQWKHEKEYRLVLLDTVVGRNTDLASRKLRYRLEDLSGVIFGIKTSEKDKISILRILKAKADAVGGANINFRQAIYSNRTQQIQLVPLTIINKQFSVERS